MYESDTSANVATILKLNIHGRRQDDATRLFPDTTLSRRVVLAAERPTAAAVLRRDDKRDTGFSSASNSRCI
jgi:hypothetical protein